MKRLFDLTFVFLIIPIILVPFLFTCIAIRLTSNGPIFYLSDRVGSKNIIFRMPKFRTMRKDTPAVATHLLKNPSAYITPIGSFLRKSSLDELPQFWSVIKGDMSLVGPRPALYNQKDLIALRSKAGIDSLLPGLTGWAQIYGRDNLSVHKKVLLDIEYKQRQSFFLDLKIIGLTIVKVIKREGISH